MKTSLLHPGLRAPGFVSVVLFIIYFGNQLSGDVLDPATKTQIESLVSEKTARSPAQRKMDSQLVYFGLQRRNPASTSAFRMLRTNIQANEEGRVLLDITGTVSDDLLKSIAATGGVVVNKAIPFGAIRARVPVDKIEVLADRPDIRFIRPAVLGTTNTGPVTSEGDRTHRANTARQTFSTNGGTGIKIGVLSDGVDTLVAAKSAGEINASASVINGQAGRGDEGTAMMEIIQDIVPNAQLYFATAADGPASFATNILALQAAGCSIIVDDYTYYNESPFQDAIIARAVNTVSAQGVMYFSSARNSGSKDKGSSGTWEGDFADGGAATIASGRLHDFGGGVTANRVTTTNLPRADLFWSDPLGSVGQGSNNDYDLFVVDASGTVVRSSTNIQDGTQDPYESVDTLLVGERIVIVKSATAQPRFLHLDSGRSRLTVNTAGNVRGHNAVGASNAFCVAATPVDRSPAPGFFVGGVTNPVEVFSSDGPRRIFFTSDGIAITPGNFSSTGGQLLNKPDFTAADGVATSIAGFNPFFGTSAAAPHAAAIAALLKSYNPALTPADVRALLNNTALDIEATGKDRDSGSGIIMALAAIQAAPVGPMPAPPNNAQVTIVAP